MSRKSTVAHGDNGASFEASFLRLQEVVQKLSEGNLTLQDALSAYEEGMELATSCGRMLDEAELRVKQVSERALKAGAASIADLENFSPNGEAPQELVSLEIETFETTVLLTGQDTERLQVGKRPAIAKPQIETSDDNLFADLDPLFDEDD